MKLGVAAAPKCTHPLTLFVRHCFRLALVKARGLETCWTLAYVLTDVQADNAARLPGICRNYKFRKKCARNIKKYRSYSHFLSFPPILFFTRLLFPIILLLILLFLLLYFFISFFCRFILFFPSLYSSSSSSFLCISPSSFF
jgi:hypothetical protein